jgi:hypothetical protein
MQNSNGVVLKLQGFEVGFEASVDLGRLTISLKWHARRRRAPETAHAYTMLQKGDQ